jgi:transcription elongation factor GreB
MGEGVSGCGKSWRAGAPASYKQPAMSKAFVNEDAGPEDEEPLEPEAPRAPRHITPEGYQKLVDELDHLRKVERPRVTREVEAAAALGDRSENAEYIYGKRRLREIDRRLRFLARRIESLVVVRHAAEQDGRVFFGATVTLEDEGGARVSYRLVGGDEIDLDKRWISVDSPVGKAVLGKHEGDFVTVRRPKGDVELRVVGVRYGRGDGEAGSPSPGEGRA